MVELTTRVPTVLMLVLLSTAGCLDGPKDGGPAPPNEVWTEIPAGLSTIFLDRAFVSDEWVALEFMSMAPTNVSSRFHLEDGKTAWIAEPIGSDPDLHDLCIFHSWGRPVSLTTLQVVGTEAGLAQDVRIDPTLGIPGGVPLMFTLATEAIEVGPGSGTLVLFGLAYASKWLEQGLRPYLEVNAEASVSWRIHSTGPASCATRLAQYDDGEYLHAPAFQDVEWVEIARDAEGQVFAWTILQAQGGFTARASADGSDVWSHVQPPGDDERVWANMTFPPDSRFRFRIESMRNDAVLFDRPMQTFAWIEVADARGVAEIFPVA